MLKSSIDEQRFDTSRKLSLAKNNLSKSNYFFGFFKNIPLFNFANTDVTTTSVGTKPLTSTFFDNKGIGSRWQAQLGLRYIFN